MPADAHHTRPKWEIDLLSHHLAQELNATEGLDLDDEDLALIASGTPAPAGGPRRASAFGTPPRLH